MMKMFFESKLAIANIMRNGGYIMENGMSRQHLSGKDLIAIGIFSALFYLFCMVSHMIGGIHPLAWVLSPALAAIFCAIPYLVLMAKVRKPFCAFVMSVVVGLMYLLTGRSNNWALVIYLVVGILAEVIRYISRYKSFLGDAVSYIVVSLELIGSLLPLWMDSENFLKDALEMGFSQDYVNSCERYTSISTLVVCIFVIVVCAFIGVLVTRKLCKKHFEKAGLM